MHTRNTCLTELCTWPDDVEVTTEAVGSHPRLWMDRYLKTRNRTEQWTCSCHHRQGFNDLGGQSVDNEVAAMFMSVCIYYSQGCTVKSTSHHHVQSTQILEQILGFSLACWGHWFCLLLFLVFSYSSKASCLLSKFSSAFFKTAICPFPCLNVVLTSLSVFQCPQTCPHYHFLSTFGCCLSLF